MQNVENTVSFSQINELKSQGNDLFKSKNFKTASISYNTAIQLLNQLQANSSDFGTEKENLLAVLYANLAACSLQSQEYEKCIEECTKSLEFNGRNVKSLYRRHQAYKQMNLVHQAMLGKRS
jgi:tetratricopeptide (TPR) repeat protein